jgi:hypothetical protein
VYRSNEIVTWYGNLILQRKNSASQRTNYQQSQAWQLDLCLSQKIATLLAYGTVIFLAGFVGKQAV